MSRTNSKNRSTNRSTKEDVYLRSLNQARILNALVDMSWAWLAICTFLLWWDKSVDILSMVGVMFIFCGLFLFVEIFGVFNYMTRKLLFKQRISSNKKRKDTARLTAQDIRNIAWGSNMFWFPALFLCCQGALDLLKIMLAA